jgi:D-alanyl-D-alanine-carboxypeptidase/D-alanyl-D-alanine-endopeptidase
MKRLAMAVAASTLAIAAPAAAQDAAGDWAGVLEVTPTVKLPLIVHIKRDEAGAVSGTIDSPSQGANAIPLSEVVASDGKLAFKVTAISGAYEATWKPDDKSWDGKWSQGGTTLPLVLAARRPPEPLPANWRLPTNDGISQLISERIAPRPGQGIAVGVLEPGGKRVVTGGPVNADTVFEIGSISKVFTALILADMVAKGEVALDDPAEMYLPAGAKMPERGGRKITLGDLSQHVSGLPRLADNMPMSDPADPYFDDSNERMIEFLASYQLPREIGAQAEYSNFAVGLLGYLLERAAGKDYETLLRERITGPIAMGDTSIALSADQQARFAQGHDEYMRPAKPWRFVRPGAGGIRSTANDMLTFAAAAIDPKSPIAPAMKIALGARVPGGNQGYEQALGWQVGKLEPGAREMLIHNGGTGGFRSVLALLPAEGKAVVVLANAAAEPATTDLGLHILAGFPRAPTPPVPPAPPPVAARTEISLPAAELDKFVGRFDFRGGVVFVFTREGDKLFARRDGAGPKLQIFPEAPLKFFWKVVNADVTFIAEANGKINEADFKQDSYSAKGKRVEP